MCVSFSDETTILNEKSLNCCTVDYPYYGTPVVMKSCSTEAEAPIVLCESNDTYTGMLPSNDSIFLEKIIVHSIKIGIERLGFQLLPFQTYLYGIT